MSKWSVYGIHAVDDKGHSMACCKDEETGKQVASDHNCHEALIQMVTDYEKTVNSLSDTELIKKAFEFVEKSFRLAKDGK